jgi:hypothetical protein
MGSGLPHAHTRGRVCSPGMASHSPGALSSHGRHPFFLWGLPDPHGVLGTSPALLCPALAMRLTNQHLAPSLSLQWKHWTQTGPPWHWLRTLGLGETEAFPFPVGGPATRGHHCSCIMWREPIEGKGCQPFLKPTALTLTVVKPIHSFFAQISLS